MHIAKHQGHMEASSWPSVSKKLQQTTCQDMVFIRPPEISDGAFDLRMYNIWFWFCKLLLLFKMNTTTDTGMQ
jgi:hypothetical protein